MSKPVILTGLRANNDLHIGNYLGALLPIVDMANEHAGDYQINLFVPDLHSFTTPIDHKTLYAQTMGNLRLYAAAGLKLAHPDVHLYRQSYIPAHSELAWILECFTGFGEMGRMIQFKEKAGVSNVEVIEKAVDRLPEHGGRGEQAFKNISQAAVGKEKLSRESAHMMDALIRGVIAESSVKSSVGLFNYPVLMAADILLYGATYVPVGDDQTQHLEFTRDIAGRMNAKFGTLFTVPEPVKKQHEFFGKDQGLRVRDLMNPDKKMSKSDATGKGVIFLTDSPEVAKKKIMSATTDSMGKVAYNYAEQPGICNLLDLLILLGDKPKKEVLAEFVGQAQYGPLKSRVAEVVGEFLTTFQSELKKVDDKKLSAKLEVSEKAMQVQAGEALLRVQKAVGLRPR